MEKGRSLVGAWLVAMAGCTSSGDSTPLQLKSIDEGVSTATVATETALPVASGSAPLAQISVSAANAPPAAQAAGTFGAHARAATTPSGAALRGRRGKVSSRPGGANARRRFPADVSSGGGPTMREAVSHAVYVLLPGQTPENVPIPSTWGNPEGFLRDLGQSEFIHVVDEYVGSTAPNRYTVGASIIVSFDPGPGRNSTQLVDADTASIVYAAATQLGVSGLGHLFHLFLTPGTDICLNANDCYSPDDLTTFSVCAYHSGWLYSDIGPAIYTVEPHENIDGCWVGTGTPNGPLVDSTDNALAHETIEAITDPELDAWRNLSVAGWLGVEVADECQFLAWAPGATWDWDNVPSVPIGAHVYGVQAIYSNLAHACTTGPTRAYPALPPGTPSSH